MAAPVTDDDFAPLPPRRKPARRDESETSRTGKVLSYLKNLPKTHARKVHTGPMGEGGHPDIDGCREGRAFKIEMKRHGEVPNDRQMARLIVWQAAGALVGWAEDVEHAKQIMAYWDDYEWRNPLTGPGAPPRNERGIHDAPDSPASGRERRTGNAPLAAARDASQPARRGR